MVDKDVAVTTARADWLDIDDADLGRAAATRTPLQLRHHAQLFADFEPSALRDLGRSIPVAWVTVNEGAQPLLTKPLPRLRYPDGGAALDDLYQRCLSVRLYHVNHTPEMGPLIRETLDQAERILGSYGGGTVRRDSSLFCGSPGSTVPVHADRHDNILLQLVGTKDVMVGRFSDPARQLEEVERNCPHHLYLETMPDEVEVIRLGPGDGVYLPPYTIHWVICGSEPSTALSASFSTASSEQEEAVHAANHYLRRLHLRPGAPGRSTTIDRTKAAGFHLMRRLRKRAS